MKNTKMSRKFSTKLLVLFSLLFINKVIAMPELLESIVINPKSTPDAVVIWLHGLGADGYDFEPIVPELNLPDSAAIKFIFPHAPKIPVTVNAGYVMRAWYDIVSADLSAQQDAEGIKRSAEQLSNVIDAEIKAGMPPEKIILAGFSQGGAIILQAGLRYPQSLGGLMVLSSYVPLASTLEAEKNTANQDIAIFYAHGDQDDVIPISFAEQSRDLLKEQGYAVEWHHYPMPHAVIPDEIDAIGKWLKTRLKIQ